MNEIIKEKVSCLTSYNRETGKVTPKKIRWQGREIIFQKCSYHHKIWQGRILLHIFHVTDGTIDYRLQLNTDTLQTVLEEISDGGTD